MLEFMQPFDGTQPEVSAEQKREAERRLDSIAESIQNRWSDHVVYDAPDSAEEGPPRRVLELEDVDAENGHVLRFRVVSYYIAEDDKWVPNIWVRHIARDSNGAVDSDRTHVYGRRDDNGVTRSDGRDFAHTTLNLTNIPVLLDEVEQDEPNRKLMTTMGFNNQPVLAEELDALYAASMFATPVIGEARRRRLFARF